MSDAVEPKVEGLARTYLLDRVVECLLAANEPLRVSQILSSVQHDGAFTSRVLRAVMQTSDRFQPVDRRWMLASPESDVRRPLEANIEQVLQTAGRPMKAVPVARLLAEGLGRPPDVLLPGVEQVLRGRGKYFPAGDAWGLAEWLLDVDDHDEDEIIFRNFFFDEEELAQFRQKIGSFRWSRSDLVGSAVKLVGKAGVPVPNKALQFLAWRAGHHAFHPERFFAGLFAREEVTFLSTGHWCSADTIEEFSHVLEAFAEQLSEQAPEVVAEGVADARAGMYHIGEKEVDEVASLLGDLRSHRISQIIEALFELSPGERDYNAAFGNVWGAMGADERFAWVGGERWRLAGTVPRGVSRVPELLDLPYLPYFVNEDGEAMDVELAEEGFEGDLVEWVKDPRVMIAGQPIPEGTVPSEPPARVAAPVRYEHRLAGTLPVYGDLRALIPGQPDVVELTFYHNARSFTGWLSNTTNLAVELGSFYDRLDLPLCGGVFHIQPRGRGVAGVTTDFTAAYTAGEVDDLVAVSDERLAKLEAMREDPENIQTSTFDLLRKIMEGHNRKGAHFVTLFTEANVVRRTHAYLVASLLSAYACFTYLRPGYWGYDEKKVDQGIRKQKRKFIKE
ncbi:MAG: hypothetical protein HY321_12085 [Armatimonadetes bacterium]|nr:hypothetical protein [Armatimonadota bacterium]